MDFKIVTEPAIEPVTIAEIKAHLHLDDVTGEPAPLALSPSLSSVAGNLSAGAYRYRVTFVTAEGETEGGLISAPVTVTDPEAAGQISLTNIPTGGWPVTSRKIYRTEANGSTYLFLASVSGNSTTTYTDNIADLELGEACPATNTTADPLLTAIRKVAREMVEQYTSRALITQTWDFFTDSFLRQIIIPKSPLTSVASLQYMDTDGNYQTLSTDDYEVIADAEPGFIIPALNVYWPSTARHPHAVKIRFVAGYGDLASDVPQGIKQAILVLCAHLYENRDMVTMKSAQSSPQIIPWSAQWLMDQYRVWSF